MNKPKPKVEPPQEPAGDNEKTTSQQDTNQTNKTDEHKKQDQKKQEDMDVDNTFF